MNHRISVEPKPEVCDPQSKQLLKEIREYFHLPVDDLKIKKIYSIKKPLTKEQLAAIANGPLIDPILENSALEEEYGEYYDWCIEIGFRPGLTDNPGKTAQLTIEDFLGVKFTGEEKVSSSIQYLIKGRLSKTQLERVSQELLANPLVEEIRISSMSPHFVEEVPILLPDEALIALSKKRQLALNLKEMQAIRAYYSKTEVSKKRSRRGLPLCPTDVELEAIAQTWSEHCKHKIFNATIHYTADGQTETIHSLFNTYIKKATDQLKNDWLVSVFSDNAGIIRLNDTYNLAFKVETHNSPSALDPYGGALTGILGVNRDIMGAGMGARLLANTDVFCFAPPTFTEPLPERLLHPKRILEGVRKGVEHGGNKSGVPTVNGCLVFDERYLGKPLVYCGTLGIMPATIGGIPSHIKTIHEGDRIVIAGGRTGKDGIHGATFSSEELHAESPTSAVQIGDPFTQKKLHDFILEARDALLYRTITDNGAGGFSSSVGELAQLSGGCEIHLDKALLKYEGLLPWEILLSESQERMTLAVPEEHLSDLKHLADLHEVEIVDIGLFTATSDFHVLYQGKTVGLLEMDFLHHGVPQMELDAEWRCQPEKTFNVENFYQPEDCHQMLTRFNICSKEPIVRQYDHEVQGNTILKPLEGDAAIIYAHNEGIVISNGICPRYSDLDTYHMAANAIDEALRNAVSVGCDPNTIAILDNFCWPDPLYHPEKTPDGKYKLAQLVRANQALYDYATAFGTPIISGKDSMKNDYKIGDRKISIPPTLLISAVGKITDVHKAVSMDVKIPGDLVYVIGLTKEELGGSEYAQMKGIKGGIVPKVDAILAKQTYDQLFDAMQQELVASCHDCSDGGLVIALIESALAGNYGMDLDLHHLPFQGQRADPVLLFSESASRFVVTIAPTNSKAFEKVMKGIPLGCIGKVTKEKVFSIHGILDEQLSTLKSSFQKTFGEFYGH